MISTSLRAGWRRRRSDSGDTLVEILITILIVSVTGLALMQAFTSTISGSAQDRSLAANDLVLRAAAESAFSLIEQQSSPAYSACATASTYNQAAGTPAYGATNGYSASIVTVQYWTGIAWSSNPPTDCTTPIPQLITMTVTNANGTTETTNFVVNNLKFSLSKTSPVIVTGLTPNQVQDNSSSVSMTLSGSGFMPDAQVTIANASAPTGVSTVGVTYNGSSSLTILVSVGPSVPAGNFNVTVSNVSEGTSGTGAGLLIVTPAPTILGVSPGAISQGATATYTLNGVKFGAGMTVSVFAAGGAPSGITVGTIDVFSDSSATIVLTASGGASTGYDYFSASLPGGTASTSESYLQVVPPPTITSATTGSSTGPSPCDPGYQGTGTCVITGTNFQLGATVSITAGGSPAIAVGQVNSSLVTSPNQITINVSGATGGVAGATADLTVTNPDGSTVSLANGFKNG